MLNRVLEKKKKTEKTKNKTKINFFQESILEMNLFGWN